MKLYYVTTFPERRFDPDVRSETSVLAISKSESVIKEFAKKLKNECFEIRSFETDVEIAEKVSIVYYWDLEDPSWARIEFVGNTMQDCEKWWLADDEWACYIDPDDYDEIPSFAEYLDEDRRYTGLDVQEIVLI